MDGHLYPQPSSSPGVRVVHNGELVDMILPPSFTSLQADNTENMERNGGPSEAPDPAAPQVQTHENGYSSTATTPAASARVQADVSVDLLDLDTGAVVTSKRDMVEDFMITAGYSLSTPTESERQENAACMAGITEAELLLVQTYLDKYFNGQLKISEDPNPPSQYTSDYWNNFIKPFYLPYLMDEVESDQQPQPSENTSE